MYNKSHPGKSFSAARRSLDLTSNGIEWTRQHCRPATASDRAAADAQPLNPHLSSIIRADAVASYVRRASHLAAASRPEIESSGRAVTAPTVVELVGDVRARLCPFRADELPTVGSPRIAHGRPYPASRCTVALPTPTVSSTRSLPLRRTTTAPRFTDSP